MRRAVYPGTFDPMTNGHFDLIERASQLFDEVVVAVSENPNKTKLFTLEERISIVEELTADIPNVVVKGFNILLVDFLHQEKSRVILRGLRALSDFEFEFHLASANKRLNPDIETIFMTHGGDISSFADPRVVKYLDQKYSSLGLS